MNKRWYGPAPAEPTQSVMFLPGITRSDDFEFVTNELESHEWCLSKWVSTEVCGDTSGAARFLCMLFRYWFIAKWVTFC